MNAPRRKRRSCVGVRCLRTSSPYALAAVLCLSVAPAAQTGDRAQTLPVNLNVLSYDDTLNAILLSGDFANTLEHPLRAIRGTLSLGRGVGTNAIDLGFQHQLRRPVRPGEHGTWSVWIDFSADTPEHVALKNTPLNVLSPVLKLSRVLYDNGSEEAFPP